MEETKTEKRPVNYRKRIERVRSHLPIAKVLMHFGAQLYRTDGDCQLKCVFPDHDDRNPSSRMFHDSNKYHCFVVGSMVTSSML